MQGLCVPCTGAVRDELKHGQQPPLHAVTACFNMPDLKSLWCFVHCSAQEVKERFGKYGMVRDVYLPLDHYTRHAACAFTMPCRELSSRQACSCASLKHAWCKRHRQVPCFPPGRALGTSKILHTSGPARVHHWQRARGKLLMSSAAQSQATSCCQPRAGPWSAAPPSRQGPPSPRPERTAGKPVKTPAKAVPKLSRERGREPLQCPPSPSARAPDVLGQGQARADKSP